MIQGQIDWSLIGAGVAIGALIIALDEVLRITEKMRLPPLAVGLGMYLPASTTAPVVLGALVGWGYQRWIGKDANADRARRFGVLVASGLIVGESLFGVLLAAIIVFTGEPTPLALVGDGFANASTVLGVLVFIAVTAALFNWSRRLAR